MADTAEGEKRFHLDFRPLHAPDTLTELDRVELWLFENKTRIMGAHDIHFGVQADEAFNRRRQLKDQLSSRVPVLEFTIPIPNSGLVKRFAGLFNGVVAFHEETLVDRKQALARVSDPIQRSELMVRPYQATLGINIPLPFRIKHFPIART